jgi:hypothetical protein
VVKLDPLASLGVIVAILGSGIVASVLKAKRRVTGSTGSATGKDGVPAPAGSD